MNAENWSDKEALRRLRDVIVRVPKATWGGSQSTTVQGIASYGHDMACVQEVTKRVLTAVLCPRPDPEIGDDGYRDERRHDAVEALEWAEAWVEWRNKNDWPSIRSVFLEKPWDKS